MKPIQRFPIRIPVILRKLFTRKMTEKETGLLPENVSATVRVTSRTAWFTVSGMFSAALPRSRMISRSL